MDFYLKFASEEEARTVLYTVTPAVLNEEGEVVTEETVKPNYQNIDVLGTLYERPPVDAPEDAPEDYVPVEIPGWHVNVRVMADEDGSPLEPYRVDPEPQVWRRVWG